MEVSLIGTCFVPDELTKTEIIPEKLPETQQKLLTVISKLEVMPTTLPFYIHSVVFQLQLKTILKKAVFGAYNSEISVKYYHVGDWYPVSTNTYKTDEHTEFP